MKKLFLIMLIILPLIANAQWTNTSGVTHLSTGNASNNVGINTTTAAAKLEVVGPGTSLWSILNLKNNAPTDLSLYSASTSNTYGSRLYSYRSRGTITTPQDISGSDFVGGWYGLSQIGGSYRHVASIEFQNGPSPGATNYGGVMKFNTGLNAVRMTINQNGEIGIAKAPTAGIKLDIGGNASVDETLKIASATIPSGYVLAVGGKTITEEVVVRLKGSWPDYVFTNDYKLMPLTELESFINRNKHLPEVPAAKEVAENGVALGDMSATLLKKVEELTLYVIELKKENEAQQKLIEQLSEKQ